MRENENNVEIFDRRQKQDENGTETWDSGNYKQGDYSKTWNKIDTELVSGKSHHNEYASEKRTLQQHDWEIGNRSDEEGNKETWDTYNVNEQDKGSWDNKTVRTKTRIDGFEESLIN